MFSAWSASTRVTEQQHDTHIVALVTKERRMNHLRLPAHWHECLAPQMPCLPHPRHFCPESPAAVLMATHRVMVKGSGSALMPTCRPIGWLPAHRTCSALSQEGFRFCNSIDITPLLPLAPGRHNRSRSPATYAPVAGCPACADRLGCNG